VEDRTPKAVGGAEVKPVTTGDAAGTSLEAVKKGVLAKRSVYFDYDSYALKGDSLEALKKNAEYLKAHRDLEVLVAGHCDQRGTIEYNLSLGQNRAKGVREYYIRLGVPGKALATISYGKESTVCNESTEDCWSQNRRGETRVRSRTASAAPPAGDTQ
jgi:peptidoglycan-associated lipoprotein